MKFQKKNTQKNTVAFLSGRMTAPELIAAAQSLQTLAGELLGHLAVACGKCCGCDECPDDTDEDSPLNSLPEDLLDAFVEAGVCLDLLEKHLILEDIVYGD